MSAWIQLAQRREAGERAELIAAISVAMSGDRKAIQKAIKKLVTESR